MNEQQIYEYNKKCNIQENQFYNYLKKNEYINPFYEKFIIFKMNQNPNCGMSIQTQNTFYYFFIIFLIYLLFATLRHK